MLPADLHRRILWFTVRTGAHVDGADMKLVLVQRSKVGHYSWWWRRFNAPLIAGVHPTLR